MMNVAISGASGFVGSHVLDVLLDHLALQVRVTALVRDESSLHRKHERLTVVKGDIHRPAVDLYDQLGRPDLFYHLAWSGLPNYEQAFHFECELPLQYSFLKNLVAAGLPKLLVAGTCFEYGQINGPLSITTPCAESINAYAFAKRALHQQLTFLQKDSSYILNWARIFYMYGDRQRHGSLFSALKLAANNGDMVFPMSSGEQIRDYLPVEQAAAQLVNYAFHSRGSGVRNICSGNPVSVRKMAETWCVENNWNLQLQLGKKAHSSSEPMAFWGIK